MTEIGAFFLGLLPTVVAGAIAFYLQRAQKQRDAHIEDQATARKKESLLSLEVTMAAAKLSYACAAAIKRGEPNGEMEEAMESYEKAKSAYYHFINEQAADHLTQK